MSSSSSTCSRALASELKLSVECGSIPPHDVDSTHRSLFLLSFDGKDSTSYIHHQSVHPIIPSNCSPFPSPLSAPCFSWCALLPHHSPGLVQPRLLSATTLATAFIPYPMLLLISPVTVGKSKRRNCSSPSRLPCNLPIIAALFPPPFPYHFTRKLRVRTIGTRRRGQLRSFLPDTYLHIKTHPQPIGGAIEINA